MQFTAQIALNLSYKAHKYIYLSFLKLIIRINAYQYGSLLSYKVIFFHHCAYFSCSAPIFSTIRLKLDIIFQSQSKGLLFHLFVILYPYKCSLNRIRTYDLATIKGVIDHLSHYAISDYIIYCFYLI